MIFRFTAYHDQAGKKRKGISDGLGRMVRVIEDPSGQNLATDYVFDTLGNLRKTIQGEQSRYFTYDSLGRLRFAKQPEQESNTSFNFTDPITNNSSWSVKYEYDNNGNITNTTDARGVSVSGTYDNFNRLKLRDYSDDTPDVSFYYDGKGLPSVPNFAKGKTTRIASSVSETRYTSFDNLGRLLTHEQITDGKTYPTAYQYNLSGAITSETYPSGRVMTQNLDQDGILESLWGQKANQTSAKLYLDQISYNSAGNIEKMRLGNGRWETAAYNNRQQIVQIGLGYSNNDKSLLKLDYSYGTNLENNGSLREQKINFAGISNEIKQTYTYDDLNRLKSSTETANAQVAWKQTFSYDRFGNRTLDAASTTTLTQNVSQKIANPLINTADNRLKSDQDNDNVSDYVYDKAGNLTVDAENQRFVFDAENRMKEFFHSTNQTNTPDAVYRYDGDGKRVKKISGNNLTIFVYNSSGQLIAEYANQTAANPQVSYLTADHLGSPRIITGNNGEVISRHDYMAFGADISETLGNVGNRTTAQGYGKADEIRKQYTGYERDDESGLDFAQARYYNSSHGRFTSIDPLTASANVKDPQTFNRYMYAMNSPYKFTDPLGLISQETGGNWINSGGFTGGCSASASNCNYDDNDPGFASQNTPTPESHTNEAAEITSSDNEGDGQEAEPALAPPAPPDQNAETTGSNETSDNTELNNLQSDAGSYGFSNIQNGATESENLGINGSSESQSDSLYEIFNDFRLRFAKGGNLPLNGTGVISEEIKGLLPSLYKVTLETYRMGRKYSKEGRENQNKADEIFNLAFEFIIAQSNYIGTRFDSPRYLVADGKKISYSTFELTSYVQNKLQTAFKLGVRDERKRGIQLTKR